MEKKILIIAGGGIGRTVERLVTELEMLEVVNLVSHNNASVKQRLKYIPILPIVVNEMPSKKALKQIHKNNIKKGWKRR